MRRLILGGLLTFALTAGGCGGAGTPSASSSAEAAVAAAQRSLDDRTAGRIEFVMTATAEEGEPVGFEIEGEYSFEPSDELAVVDLTYRQVLGEETTETNIVSTGERAWVVVDGEAAELTDDQIAPLAVGDGERSSAVPDLDLAGWLRDGEVEEEGTKSTVRGAVRASALIVDLQNLAAQAARAQGEELDEATARQIDRSVESSEMTIESRDESFESLRAVVDFGAEVPSELRDALGAYAAARLEVSMTVEDIETPLRVEEPDSA